MDVLSRKCFVALLKDKTSSHVAKALEKIMEESGETPSYIVSDRFRSWFVLA